MKAKPLEFEKPIYELYEKLDKLENLSGKHPININTEVDNIKKRIEDLKKKTYENITASQTLQLARHQNRPDCLSLARLMCKKFYELHGDRQFKDDPSIIAGICYIENEKVLIIGHQKGHDTKENIYRNFGMPHPEGYRKALRLMQLADKFNIPIITFIDTPGAFPGKEAEERGQSEAIARNLKEMMSINVPIFSYVIGEGGSGGALGIGVANKLYMLQYAVYSVISPEGCASILFRDASKSSEACEKLKITAEDVLKLGIADKIINEPLGGAHHNWKIMAATLKENILKDIQNYKQFNSKQIKDERYNKFRKIGNFSSNES